MYSFEEYKKLKYELGEYKRNLIKLVSDYVEYNDDFRKEHDLDDFSYVIDLEYDHLRDYYELVYSQKNYRVNYISITKKEYDDIVNYMKDPLLYKSTKKYNI